VDVEALPQRGHSGFLVDADAIRDELSEALARHSPLEGIRKLYINWVLMELRQVRTLRGPAGSEGHLSDFTIDVEMREGDETSGSAELAGSASQNSREEHRAPALSSDQALRHVLRGELARIALRDGILALAGAWLRGKVDKFANVEALEKLDRGSFPAWFRRDYWTFYLLHSREELLHLQPVLSFLGEVYGVVLPFVRQSGWVDWWASRLVLEAVESAWEVASRVRGMPDFCDSLPPGNVRHPEEPLPIAPLVPLSFSGPGNEEYIEYSRILEASRGIGKYPQGPSVPEKASPTEAGASTISAARERASDAPSFKGILQDALEGKRTKPDLDQVLPETTGSETGSEGILNEPQDSLPHPSALPTEEATGNDNLFEEEL